MYTFKCSSREIACDGYLQVCVSSSYAARQEARMRGWEDSMRGDRWYCPAHAWMAAAFRPWEHEDWCPAYRAAHYVCYCGPEEESTHALVLPPFDPPVLVRVRGRCGELDRVRRRVTNVKVKEEFL